VPDASTTARDEEANRKWQQAEVRLAERLGQ
jgi:hypothetical protein